jgi:hypothetical protein
MNKKRAITWGSVGAALLAGGALAALVRHMHHDGDIPAEEQSEHQTGLEHVRALAHGISTVDIKPRRGSKDTNPESSRLSRALRRIKPHNIADHLAGFQFRDVLVMRLRALDSGKLKPPADHWLEYWLTRLEHDVALDEEPRADD